MYTVTVLQVICMLLIAVEYYGQISKLIHKKKVGSISWTYWITKNLITLLQIITLFISGATLKSYVSQVLSFILCLIVFGLMIKYHHND